MDLVVVDLAKDPLIAEPSARSATRNSNRDKALAVELTKVPQNPPTDRVENTPDPSVRFESQ